MTTKNEIQEWFEECVTGGYDYMLVVTDTFDYTVFSVGAFIKDFEEAFEHYNSSKEMLRIMEVYDLHMDMEEQLQEHRAWHKP